MMKRKKRKKKKIILFLFTALVLACSLIIAIYFYIEKSLPNKIEVSIGEKLDQNKIINLSFFDVQIHTNSLVDTSNVGKSKIVYTYNYLFLKFDKTIEVVVLDKTAPSFINFNDKIELFVNEKYIEEEYKVIDNVDEEKDLKVDIRGEVDTTKVGNYYLVYTATDKSNNKTEMVKKVIVSERPTIDFSNPNFDLKDHFEDVILKETDKMGDSYMDNIYFAGDSVFWNFTKFNIYNSSKVWAKPCTDPKNIYTQKVEVNNVQSKYTIPELIEKNNPKYVILGIGGCQTQEYDIDKFIEQYTDFLVDMKNNYKNTNIIVQTFAPVIESSSIPLHKNSNRNKYNYYITRMCEKLDIPVMDISMIFKDSRGNCKTNLCMSDGFHPNVKGMKLIVDYVRTHGYEEKE